MKSFSERKEYTPPFYNKPSWELGIFILVE